jgi:hypothetical protein
MALRAVALTGSATALRTRFVKCIFRIRLSTGFAPYQFLLQPHHIAATSVLISLIPSLFAVQYPQAATTIQRPTASISVHLFCLSLRSRTAPTKFLFTNFQSIAVYRCAIDLSVQQSNLSKLITARFGCGLDHTVRALDATPK